MKTLTKTMAVVVSALVAAACSDRSAQQQANAVKDQANQKADQLKEQAGQQADQMKQQANAAKEHADKRAERIKNEQAQRHHAQNGKMSQEQLRHAQLELKDQGYYHGKVDGIMGPQTRDAVKKFQKDQNLAMNGQFDSETITRLSQRAGSAAGKS